MKKKLVITLVIALIGYQLNVVYKVGNVRDRCLFLFIAVRDAVDTVNTIQIILYLKQQQDAPVNVRFL